MKQIFLFLLLVAAFTGNAQTAAERKAQYNLSDGLAIQGYDPVSYFTKGKAEKGKAEWAVAYLGVTYHFASKENKDAFLKNPSGYEPQYGGWCAFAMGDYGKKVKIDPETFKILDGKLYLFYNAFFNNTLKSWNKDEKNLKEKADKNWAAFIKK